MGGKRGKWGDGQATDLRIHHDLEYDSRHFFGFSSSKHISLIQFIHSSSRKVS